MGQGLGGLLTQIGITRDDVVGVGLGTPGTMDIPAGKLLEPPNLPTWHHFPIRDKLQTITHRPVSFANDANAAAYGEFWIGSGKKFHSIVMLTLGTGVGGGIIIGDLSIDGENSHGSECGHIIIDYQNDARMCSCGNRGHLEAYASATALIRRTEEVLNVTTRASTVRARLADGEELTPLLLAREAEEGDALSLELILDTAMYLGVGVVSLMHTIDPGAVILGGAMNFGGHEKPLGRRFLERVREEVRARAFETLVERTVVDFALLGGHAGYIGAAGIARMNYHKSEGK
jgi:glucokinase